MSKNMRQSWVAVAAAGALAAALLSVSLANAHVGVVPAEVPADSSHAFTVRVPTEREVPTIRVRIEFPNGLTVSRFRPAPGWTRQVDRDAQERIIAATWSGGQIAPGEYEDFTFMARTPKEAGAIGFKAYQSYQGGETVEWVNSQGASERPAAYVTVKAGGGTADDHGAGAAPPSHSASAQPGAGAGGASAVVGSDLALFIALGSGVLALIALALAAVAMSRRSQTA